MPPRWICRSWKQIAGASKKVWTQPTEHARVTRAYRNGKNSEDFNTSSQPLVIPGLRHDCSFQIAFKLRQTPSPPTRPLNQVNLWQGETPSSPDFSLRRALVGGAAMARASVSNSRSLSEMMRLGGRESSQLIRARRSLSLPQTSLIQWPCHPATLANRMRVSPGRVPGHSGPGRATA